MGDHAQDGLLWFCNIGLNWRVPAVSQAHEEIGGNKNLALASLTLTRGLAKSSRSRWLCSVRRRSFSSDIDCLCGRVFMVGDIFGCVCSQSVSVKKTAHRISSAGMLGRR
jgi:hypothetical protein